MWLGTSNQSVSTQSRYAKICLQHWGLVLCSFRVLWLADKIRTASQNATSITAKIYTAIFIRHFHRIIVKSTKPLKAIWVHKIAPFVHSNFGSNVQVQHWDQPCTASVDSPFPSWALDRWLWSWPYSSCSSFPTSRWRRRTRPMAASRWRSPDWLRWQLQDGCD